MALALAACAGPRAEPPTAASVAPPITWRTQLSTGEPIRPDWWNGFGDPQLTALVERALANNVDLAIAAERVEEARAQFRLARAQFAPQIGGSTSMTAGQTLSPFGTPSDAIGGRPGIQASYDLDLFGRLRQLSRAQQAQLLASEGARDTVRLAVASGVASGYVTLRALDQRLAIARETLQRGRRRSGSRGDGRRRGTPRSWSCARRRRSTTPPNSSCPRRSWRSHEPRTRSRCCWATHRRRSRAVCRWRGSPRQQCPTICPRPCCGVGRTSFRRSRRWSPPTARWTRRVPPSCPMSRSPAQRDWCSRRRWRTRSACSRWAAACWRRYSSYIEQLDAQRGLLAADLALLQLQADRLIANVTLVQAMGGGWQPADE